MEISAQDAFEILFFESVARRDRQSVIALEMLGGLYSKHNMARQALRIDRRLARLCPDEPRIFYNLACSLSLLGRRKQAVEQLSRAIGLGYRDWDWLREDPDLESLRGYREFEELVVRAAAE